VTLDFLARAEAEKVVEIFYQVTLKFVTPYLFSFCSHQPKDESFNNGLLSQWRAYGKDGGFAIQFDTKSLERLLELDAKLNVHAHFAITDAIYGEKSTDFRFALEDIKTVASIARLTIPYVRLAKEEPNLNPLYVPVVKSATRFKTQGSPKRKRFESFMCDRQTRQCPRGALPRRRLSFDRIMARGYPT
jgi:hypothetical protein